MRRVLRLMRVFRVGDDDEAFGRHRDAVLSVVARERGRGTARRERRLETRDARRRVGLRRIRRAVGDVAARVPLLLVLDPAAEAARAATEGATCKAAHRGGRNVDGTRRWG